MDIEVRPATKTEQMYCYTQSDQIMGQTGCIGHLRAFFDCQTVRRMMSYPN